LPDLAVTDCTDDGIAEWCFLVRRQVAVIFATGSTPAALAARAATSTIPIVFYMGGDPVEQRLVASLSRPGGNLTGFGFLGFALAAKRLELLRELLPNAATIGMLVNPANPDSDFEMRDIQDAARILGRHIHTLTASSDADFDGVFATLVNQQIGALIVASDPYFSGRRGRIVALATRHGIAAIYERREFPDAGGLISYGHHRRDAYRQLGIYTGRILKGTKPADLPVLQPTRFELVINLNAAKALGIEISPKLLALADEVIE
jgi:putative tryptophan/tyrosine transport system substrate-binding protein